MVEAQESAWCTSADAADLRGDKVADIYRPETLVGWLDDPASDRGARFGREGDRWEFWSYERLAELTHRVAEGLVRVGVGSNEVVVIVQRSSPGFIASLFGSMIAGAVPSPVPATMAFHDRTSYREHVEAILHAAQPAVVVADADLVSRLQLFAKGSAVRVMPVEAILAEAGGDGAVGESRPLTDTALLQFTSGSSGRARGVRIPGSALASNVAAIRRWLRWTTKDPVASWLPVHHDMGLIGCLITPVVSQSDIWLLQPEQFIRQPLRYLRCFGEAGARLTATPNFGLDYIIRRIAPKALKGMDFSEWRAVIVGAEPLAATSFEEFHRLLAPFGLLRSALLPAYGLAEATLAVTGLALDEEWTNALVDRRSLSPGCRLELAAAGDESAVVVVGCGRPLARVSVGIASMADELLGEDHVGEIVVKGSSVATGYLDGSAPSSTRFVNGVLRTGDAGFLLDGQLFVLGRLGDSLKIRGRWLFAEDLEAALGALGAPRHRLAVALGIEKGAPTAVVVFEQAHASWMEGGTSVIRRRTEGATTVVLDVPRGTIPRTSSGKTKRQALWQAFCDGTLSPPIQDQ